MFGIQDGGEDEDLDLEGLGPSPVKPMAVGSRTFTSLVVEAEVEAGPIKSSGRGESQSSGGRENLEMPGLFRRTAKGKEKEKPPQTFKRVSPSAPPLRPAIVESPPSLDHFTESDQFSPRTGATIVERDAYDQLSTPPSDPLVEAAAAQASPSRPNRPTKLLALSDDEEDEWDPEGGRVRRTVVIVPTRPATTQAWTDDDLIEHAREDDEDRVDEEEDARVPHLAEGTTATSTTYPSSPTTTFLAPPLLSLLSLHSPSSKLNQSRLTDLRVRAIFNPVDAIRLRAIKRGQDVYLLGEGGEEGEDDEVMHAFDMRDAAEREDECEGGDDDWESENEGWKKEGVGMEKDEDDW